MHTEVLLVFMNIDIVKIFIMGYFRKEIKIPLPFSNFKLN